MLVNNHFIIISFHAGSGGSFLSNALRSAIYNIDFKICEATGNCHSFKAANIPFISGISSESFAAEMYSIDNLIYEHDQIIDCHYRNLLYLHQKSIDLNLNMFFIKIKFNPESQQHIKFLTEMLIRKTYRDKELTKQELNEFRENTHNSCYYWYWIENNNSSKQTIEIDLHDIFVGSIANKLENKFSKNVLDKVELYHQEYKKINNKLHNDLLQLLV